MAQLTAAGGSPVDGESRALTDGEVWAREQLELLRCARFAPGATGRFLAASWRRSATMRAARPELARRAYTWLALGTAAWLAPAAAGVQPFRRRLGVGLAWWGATSVMLDWHLGMFETEDGRPRQLGAADALTLARAWLVPVVADSPTVLVCGLAAVADALDGPLARRAEPTRAGRDLEGLVDASFALAALRGLTRAGRLGRAAGLAEAARLTAGVGLRHVCVPRPRAGPRGAPRSRRALDERGALRGRPRRGRGAAAARGRAAHLGVGLQRRAHRMGGSALSSPLGLISRGSVAMYPRRVPRTMREPAIRKYVRPVSSSSAATIRSSTSAWASPTSAQPPVTRTPASQPATNPAAPASTTTISGSRHTGVGSPEPRSRSERGSLAAIARCTERGPSHARSSATTASWPAVLSGSLWA